MSPVTARCADAAATTLRATAQRRTLGARGVRRQGRARPCVSFKRVKARRLLVVDDDPDCLATLSAVLVDEGYDVVEASDGQEAVALAAVDRAIDLVLSDVRMPVMDGVEALAHIKRLRAEVPVILVTAYAVEESQEQALEEGAYAVLRKPVDLHNLLRVVARASHGPVLLLVDPSAADREELLTIFRERRHRAIAVTDAEAALGALRDEVVDVVILGVSDDARGLAELEALRRGAAGAPVVLVTRGARRELLDAAARLGIAAWVPRPIQPVELARLVADLRAKPPAEASA
jgi:CheY-like chemotaxis protein